MGTEPERPIENLLRAAANKRREEAGPPLELHPATRRLLQGEVARQYPAKNARRHAPDATGASAEEPGSIGRFWLRFAVGIAVVAIAGLLAALWTMHPNRNETLLAKNDLATAPQPAKMTQEKMEPGPMPAPAYLPKESPGQAAVTKAPAIAPEKLEAQTEVGRVNIASVDRLVGEPRAQSAQPTLDRPQPPPPSNLAKNEVAASDVTIVQPATAAPDAFARRYGLDTSAPASPAPAVPPPSVGASSFTRTEPAAAAVFSNQAAQNSPRQESASKSLEVPSPVTARPNSTLKDTLSFAGAASNKTQSIAVAQQFSRMDANRATALLDKAEAAKLVLDSFQVEQLRDEFRIIDSDGSVYSGSLQASASPLSTRAYDTGGTSAGAVRSLGAARTPAAKPARISPGATESAQPASQTYFFRVTGFNNTLNQNLVFTGRVDGWSAGTGKVQTTVSRAKLSPALQSRTARISGSAVVGTNKPITIEAIPTASGK
jgi:hypothetical protein